MQTTSHLWSNEEVSGLNCRGHFASEEVILHLAEDECVPAPQYSLDGPRKPN